VYTGTTSLVGRMAGRCATVAEIGEAAKADLAHIVMAYDQLGQARGLAPGRGLVLGVAMVVV